MAQKKYPAGPLNPHKSLATGSTYKEAVAESRVGGSKTDKSNGSNK